MRFPKLLVLLFFCVSCTSSLDSSSFPHYEFSPEIAGSDLVMRYGEWTISQKEFFDAFPEFKAFHEEFSAVQTAVAIKSLAKELGSEGEIVVTGCSREAGLMTLTRLGVDISQKRLAFMDPQGKSTISAHGKTFDVLQLPLNQLDLARMQSTYYIKGQNAAEELLINKILNDTERKTLAEGIVVSQEEFKNYIRRQRIDTHMIGLTGVKKVKDALLAEKQKEVFRNYVHHYVYKSPVLSRWKKPHFKFASLPEKPFTTGRGQFQMIVFAPFDCRACLHWNQELPQFISDGIEIKYYPAVSDDSRTSSLAFYEGVLCLSEQKRDLLWEMLPKFKSVSYRSRLSEKIIDFAQEQGLDVKSYKECIGQKKYAPQLEHYQKFSQTLGVQNYPVVVAGGFVFTGAVTADDIYAAREAEATHLLHKWNTFFKVPLPKVPGNNPGDSASPR
jgi:hypothetical protein